MICKFFGLSGPMFSLALRSPDVGSVLPDMSLFREMELKRRKKKEETTSTENKIAQMKVLVKKFSRLLTLCFSEGNSQSRGVESAQGVLAAKCSSLLCRPLYLRHRLPPDKNQLNLRHPCLLLPSSPPMTETRDMLKTSYLLNLHSSFNNVSR